MGKVGEGELGSREHEAPGFNLCGPKSMLGESWRAPDLILNGYLLNNSLILCSILPWPTSYLSYRSGHQTDPKLSELCLSVLLAEMLSGHSDATENCSNLSYVVHIMFQDVSLKAHYRKLMLSYYCQTADFMSSANWRKFLKKYVLQVCNTAVHSYGFSPRSWLM
jgi:hypothetical protein